MKRSLGQLKRLLTLNESTDPQDHLDEAEIAEIQDQIEHLEYLKEEAADRERDV